MMVVRRIVAVLVLVGVLVGTWPAARAEAYAPPIPIAPPITGLCTTPVGVIACLVPIAIAGINEALVWFENTTGGAPTDDGQWCVVGEHMFPIEYAGCAAGAPIHPNPALESKAIETFTQVPEFSEDFDPLGRNIYEPVPTEECYLGVCIESVTAIHVEGFTEGTQSGYGYTVTVRYKTLPGVELPLCEHSSVKLQNSFSDHLDDLDFPAGCIAVYVNNGSVVQSSNKVSSGSCHPSQNPNNGEWRIWDLNDDGTSQYTAYQTCGVGVGGGGRNMGEDTTPGGVVIGIADGAGGWSATEEIPIEFQGSQDEITGIYVTELRCTIPGGGATTTHFGFSGTVAVDEAGVVVGECPQGKVPTRIRVAFCEGIASPGCIAVAEWSGALGGAEMPETCVLSLNHPDACEMWLEQYNGEEWVRCTESDGEVDCSGWWGDPERDLVYRCVWGGQVLPARECVTLRNFYEGTVSEPGTIVPHNPQPAEDPVPDPTTVGTPVHIGGPENPPVQRPTQTWLTTIITEWGSGATPSMQHACWPSGWGLLNPLQWVMRPIMCALTFLFVPTESPAVQLEELWEYAGTINGIGHVVAVQEILESVPSPSVGSACGWGLEGLEFHDVPLDAVQVVPCPASIGMTATAANIRTWGYGILGLGAVNMLLRWVAMRPKIGEEGIQGTLF